MRSWQPLSDLTEAFVIIENHKYLHHEEVDPEGRAVALVKIKNVREYVPAGSPWYL